MRLRSCSRPMRTGKCALDSDHRGRHSTVAFYCEVCGKHRRGSMPHVVVGVMHDEDEAFQVCFMCAVVDVERGGT